MRMRDATPGKVGGGNGGDANDAIKGGVRNAVAHDSAHKHVTGGAIYVDDIPEPDGTLHVAPGLSQRGLRWVGCRLGEPHDERSPRTAVAVDLEQGLRQDEVDRDTGPEASGVAAVLGVSP